MRVLVLILTFLSLLPLTVAPHIPNADLRSGQVLAGPGATDYAWSMFRYGSSRTGATPATAPNQPYLQWILNTGSYVYGSPSVADGLVFATSYDGKLYAIDEYDGTLKWSFTSGAPIYSSPAVANSRVFVTSKDSGVYALDEKTGSVIWSRPNISPITSSPVVADGLVFYGTWFVKFNSVFLALNATNGSIVWQYLSDDTIKSSPGVLNGRVFFGQNNGYMLALNETTGSLLWKVAVGASTISTAPALGYGMVYIGRDSSQFVSLDQATGATKWTFANGLYNATSGALANGIAYFGSGAGTVFALNATTGTKIWQYPSTGSIGAISSSPAIALGSKTIIFGSSDYNLYELNMTNGNLLWKYFVGSIISSSPAVADNRIFFGAWDFKVYSIGSNARLLASLTSNPSSLKPGTKSILTTTVTNGTILQSGVSLVFYSTLGGNFTSATMTSPGVYSCNFTAPVVSVSANDAIQVTAMKTGYASSLAQTIIMLNPFPSLSVTIHLIPGSISPGSDATIKVGVTNGSLGIPGASLQLSSSAGGGFSGIVDGGDGNYTAVYSSPLQTVTPTITVQASKRGFSMGQASASLNVSGIPNPVGVKILGIPVIFIVVGIVVLFLVALMLLRKRKIPNARQVSVPPPVYALGRLCFRQGFI